MFRRNGTVSLVLLSFFLLCGYTAPTSCKDQQIGPSKGEVIGTAVAIGAVITVGTVTLVHVSHSHHNIKGCVIDGPKGLEIQTGDKTYALSGGPTVKVGDVVRVHGSKVKKDKHSTDDQTFTVASLTKDYGPCKATPPTAPIATP